MMPTLRHNELTSNSVCVNRTHCVARSQPGCLDRIAHQFGRLERATRMGSELFFKELFRDRLTLSDW